MIHILLINSNPIISRLLTLCTREENLILEESQTLSSLERTHYDIIFIDESSYTTDIQTFQSIVTSRKNILFSYENKEISAFDTVIQKPFLPFQIMEIIEHIPALPNTRQDNDIPKTQILDASEIAKIKTLLDMETEANTPLDNTLTDTEIEAHKIQVIKEQLLSDGLEIVDEDTMIKSFDTPTLFKKEEKESMKKPKNKLKKYSKKERKLLKKAIKASLLSLSKKKIHALLQGEKINLNIQIKEKH